MALVTRPVPPAKWLAESIPGSARKLLGHVGALDALDEAGFVPNLGNTVWWAGMPRREERFRVAQSGFHARRGEVEAAFLDVARAAGVRVVADGPVTSAGTESGAWWVASRTARHRGRWLLDASGRAGVVARQGLRVRESEVATLALAGQWIQDSGSAAPDPGCTLVESYEDGWAWSVPISKRVRCVTAMVDPRRTALRRDLGIEGMWRREIGKAKRLEQRLATGRFAGPVRACPASLYSSSAHARPGLLLVGDAGSFIDPLSSYGVKKALASAWLAAVVVRSAIMDDGMAAPGRQLYNEREEEMYRTYRALSVPFFEQAADAGGHAFWQARLHAARQAAGTIEAPAGSGLASGEEPGGQSPEPPGGRSLADRQAEAFIASPEVRDAYQRIRSLPSVRFRRADSTRAARRPTIVDDRVVLVPRFISDKLPDGVCYARNVEIPRLVEIAPRYEQVPDIYEAYNAGRSPAALPDFLAALALAVGAGFLDLGEDGPGTLSKDLSGRA